MSGIYIPRLEELKCDECFWCIGYRIKCPAGNREVLLGIKHPDCPLIPVPDHGRLIDAGNLGARAFRYLLMNGQESPKVVFAQAIKDAPTIIPASTADKEGGG